MPQTRNNQTETKLLHSIKIKNSLSATVLYKSNTNWFVGSPLGKKQNCTPTNLRAKRINFFSHRNSLKSNHY